jgi:hypothetical protein
MGFHVRAALAGLVIGLITSTSFGQLIFNFTPTGSPPQAVLDAFAAAGQRWSNLFNDPVIINVTVGYSALGSGILGQTSNPGDAYTYSQVRSALLANSTSSADSSAYAFLQSGSSINLLTNRTSQNGNSATPYFDNNGSANNTNISMSRANAKALGLRTANNVQTDGSITFSSSFTWDFDPSNGITAGTFDFVGVATHEIGHLLGFTSGVDSLDGNPGLSENSFRLSTLDLFRFSSRSTGTGGGLGVPDFTADNTNKYFSLNGGATSQALFSNGVSLGDGSQASHWKDNLGIGIMDPTGAPGELLSISQNDINALDVIGWNIVAVPEPTTYALCSVAFGAGLFTWYRKRKLHCAAMEQRV